jgi:type IV pilus assembly protein PilQ
MSLKRKLEVVILAGMVLGLMVCPPAPLWRSAAAEETAAEQPSMSPVEGEGPVQEEVVGPEEMGPTVAITPTGLISFDFREAPLRDVLRLFARQVKMNIVATPLVQGTVSMKLENVKWRKALELILDVNKLKMTEDKENNIIKVMTADEVQAEPLETQIYALSYVQAEDAMEVLKPLLDEKEKIQSDKAGNKLIVHARPATHETLSAVIADLDAQTKQVLIEVKFIEASTEAGKELGIKWDFLKEYGVEAFGPGSDSDKARMGYSWQKSRTSSDQVGSSVSEDRSLSENINDSTQRTRSSLSSNADGTRTSGFDSISDLTRDISHTAGLSSARDLAWSTGTDAVKWATLSPDNLRLAISALMEDTDAKLVSNPRISTVDNKLAEIKAVKQFPIPKWTFNSDTGTWEVQGFDYKDIGVTLNVTPHINQDNFITLDVAPEVSNQTGTVIFGGGAGGTAEIPIIDSRVATTRVIVKSGETLVIGGLVKTDDVMIKSGVPLLKDIPVLGNIFKHSSKSTVSLDLLVFITPTIVEGPAATILSPPAEYVKEAAAQPKAEVTASPEEAK